MPLLGRLALSLLPLVLSAHLALALVKLNAKLGYLPLALQDPSGVKSFLAINVMQTLTPPGVLIPAGHPQMGDRRSPDRRLDLCPSWPPGLWRLLKVQGRGDEWSAPSSLRPW